VGVPRCDRLSLRVVSSMVMAEVLSSKYTTATIKSLIVLILYSMQEKGHINLILTLVGRVTLLVAS